MQVRTRLEATSSEFVHLIEQDIDGDSLLFCNRGKNREKDGLPQEVQKSVHIAHISRTVMTGLATSH